MRKQFYFLFFTLLSILILISAKYSGYTNPSSSAELGEKLFFDPILSQDSSLSCAGCHKPNFAFADTLAISPGVGGALGTRNAPSVMNMAFRDLMFYDGRAKDIIDQVHFPIEDPAEMNLKMATAIQRLQMHPQYKKWFEQLFPDGITAANIATSIAAYERTLETDNSPFDRYMNGDRSALSESAKRGRKIFLSEKAKCFDCHFGPDFTGDDFRNIGLYDEKVYVDKGRYLVTKNPEDLGKFKVPGLRNIAITGPYMHDGSFKTLRDVIEYYNNPYKFVADPINMDSLLVKPLELSEDEKLDLEAFLRALTDNRFIAKSAN